MDQPASFEIPLDQIDRSLFPEGARQPGTTAFRDAVTGFFTQELQTAAEWIRIAVDDKTVRVAWLPKGGDADPLELAIAQLTAGNYPKGIQILEFLVHWRPTEPSIRYNLGMALSDLGRVDEAIVHLEIAAAEQPASANTLVALGVALYRKGLLPNAVEALERALKAEPENPYALRNLGGCLLALGRDAERAETCLRKAVSVMPSDQQGWAGLGRALEAREQLADADDAYKRAIDLNPHNRAAEAAKEGRSRIAQRTMRKRVGGGVRPDALMYCLGALRRCQTLSAMEIQKIAFEIAALGTKGINPNDPDKRYGLRSLEGDFSGLQLLCYMYVTWKHIKPEMQIGFDLSQEYAAALTLLGDNE